jgi:hypothetical protein
LLLLAGLQIDGKVEEFRPRGVEDADQDGGRLAGRFDDAEVRAVGRRLRDLLHA